MKLIVTLLLLSGLALAQDAPITRINEGGSGKMRFWKTDYVEAEQFDARSMVVKNMTLIGDLSLLNIRADGITKGKVKVFADGKEVNVKKVMWTGPTEEQSYLRTSCYRALVSVACTSEVRSRTVVSYTNEVSIGFKPAVYTALGQAKEIRIEVSGRAYELNPAQLSMISDLLIASSPRE